MFDMSRAFDEFYNSYVVLPADIQQDLRDKRKINLKRLKDGLKEYNDDNKTNFKICEEQVQGSMSMHTVVQNDSNDYDIDIAVVFEEDNLSGLGPLQARRIVADALSRKTKQFNADPEVKTSCVRLSYQEGYHLDFAVYRRHKEEEDSEYIYEHAGSEWSVRGIKAIEDWFNNEITEKGKDLRKVIRLSKMFCKSRSGYVNMPSGLIQTVLCSEQWNDYDRIDETFYYTMQAIIDRLSDDTSVNAPVDNGRSLATREIDITRNENWKNRLSNKMECLSILFEPTCTYDDAVSAWGDFFNHTYWNDLKENALNQTYSIRKTFAYSDYKFRDTEEFIEDTYNVNEDYDVTIACKVIGNGFSLMPISDFIQKYEYRFGGFIPHNFKVKCSIAYTNAPSYDKVLWKVRNVGIEAEKRDEIRGQIEDRGLEIEENTLFKGQHYIECYLIKNNVCIAIGHVQVPIGAR